MIQVSPHLRLKPFSHAGRLFTPQSVHLTGMRWMIQARDDAGKIIWKDFPASHGLYTPCLYDPAARKIDSLPHFEWWADPLHRLFEEPQIAETKIVVHPRRKAKSWIILNTLDTIFGHSLLALFNAQFYLEQFPQHGLIVIAKPELLRFIPKDVAEIWEVQIAPKDSERWHAQLDDRFRAQCATSTEVHIACAPSHPDPSRYDVRNFGISPATGPVNTTAPRILFLYRGTRLWGGSNESERNRLERLGRWLHKFWPQARLEIWGHATPPQLPAGWANQTRRDEPTYDERLLTALAEADLVFGAHGSSMLLPSAIARLVIELVPLDKQPSLLQDFLFDTRSQNLRQHLWRRRFLYGNATLNDISARQVAQLINALVSMSAHFDFYQSTAGSDPLRDPEQLQTEFAATVTPQIQTWRANLEQSLRLPLPARLAQYLRRLAAEHD
jgi:hypothetical protein